MQFADLSSSTLSLLIITALVAGLARGFSGFGAALIFVPVASALVGPRIAAPVLLVVDTILAASMIPGAWRLADRREVGVMAIGALVGVPVGTAILALWDPVLLRWAIVVVAASMLALLVSGWRYHSKPRLPFTLGVGFAAGTLSGAAQVGGPPVVAYWLGGALPAKMVRANLLLYFAVSTVFTGIAYLAGNLITMDVLKLSLVVGPCFGLGLWGGARLFGFASEETFRRICYMLIAAAIVLGLPLWDSLRG